MDYQLNVYPSNEVEMKNIKANNSTKQIKVLSENKLSAMYKKTFDSAVSKYNERVTSGRLIDSYYKSILESNIPEVYRLALILRYEPLNKDESALSQKVIVDFKKTLETEKKMILVAAYIMSHNEYKELQVFFYPVADGFMTGLSVRNDLIGVVKQINNIPPEEDMNILQAMPLFVKHIEDMFKPINNNTFMSQEELEKIATQKDKEDPILLHAIAMNTLRKQMNEIQRVTTESQRLTNKIASEKERITHDIIWSKEKESEILIAEDARIKEEARIAEELRKAEAKKLAEEAQKREEERLKEEERKLKAAKLAAQARRNIELHNQMSKQMLSEETVSDTSENIINTNEKIDDLINNHIKWQTTYKITSDMMYNSISKAAMSDPRRLNLRNIKISGINMISDIPLVGVTIKNCEFDNCKIQLPLISSSIENCKMMECFLSESNYKNCAFQNIKFSRTELLNIDIKDIAILKSDFSNAIITNVIGNITNSFVKCNFSNAQLEKCDMKNNTFDNCNFTETEFKLCDARGANFKSCRIIKIKNIQSLFRNIKTNNI